MFPHTVTLYNVSTELDTGTMKDVLVTTSPFCVVCLWRLLRP